jgi:uncharacterized protein
LASSILLLVILAAGNILSACQLLFSETGVVYGAGWTDIHIRLPANIAMAILLTLFAIFSISASVRHWISNKIEPLCFSKIPILNTLFAVWGIVGVFWAVSLSLLPALTQWLIVEPNEITFEKTYIERNINFTLHGFHLNKVEEKQFTASDKFTPETIKNNQDLLSEVRL